MSDEPKKRPRFGAALALLLTSFLMWVLGASAAFDRNPNPIQLSLLYIAPLVTIAAIVWTVIVLRRSRTD